VRQLEIKVLSVVDGSWSQLINWCC